VQVARLGELVAAWAAAGRPATARLRIDAYPSGTPLPATAGDVCPATHTTFVVTSA
jgi:hypothetical protein